MLTYPWHHSQLFKCSTHLKGNTSSNIFMHLHKNVPVLIVADWLVTHFGLLGEDGNRGMGGGTDCVPSPSPIYRTKALIFFTVLSCTQGSKY